MNLKIDVITNDGSPLGVSEKTVYGDGTQLGVGGAELALLTMCKIWTDRGHRVRLYNNPRQPGSSSFEQLPINSLVADERRDIFLSFRSPGKAATTLPRAIHGKRVWWSCDQHSVGDYKKFAEFNTEIVTISPRHKEYFLQKYEITKSKVIDLPVRSWDYLEPVEKDMKQVIFCSVPDRGAMELAQVWELVSKAVPDAKLVITSDWRLWGPNVPAHLADKYRLRFAGLRNVEYKAALPRKEMCRLQQQSAIHLYPGIYDELFCISVAETQWAGAYPITSKVGALETTCMGYQSVNHPQTVAGVQELADETIRLLLHPDELKERQAEVQLKARERFDPERIAQEWDKSIFSL